MNQIGFVIFNGKKMIHLEQKQLHCSNTMSICKIRICCLIFISMLKQDRYWCTQIHLLL